VKYPLKLQRMVATTMRTTPAFVGVNVCWLMSAYLCYRESTNRRYRWDSRSFQSRPLGLETRRRREACRKVRRSVDHRFVPVPTKWNWSPSSLRREHPSEGGGWMDCVSSPRVDSFEKPVKTSVRNQSGNRIVFANPCHVEPRTLPCRSHYEGGVASVFLGAAETFSKAQTIGSILVSLGKDSLMKIGYGTFERRKGLV
jgi:hypothetical protein